MAIRRYMTAEELEEETGTPAQTFRHWALAGKGEGPPSVKLGRRRVWRRDLFEKWLEQQEAKQGK